MASLTVYNCSPILVADAFHNEEGLTSKPAEANVVALRNDLLDVIGIYFLFYNSCAIDTGDKDMV
jgi:hypothetical protein